MELPDTVLEDIRHKVKCGYDNRAEIFEHVIGAYGEEMGMRSEPGPMDPVTGGGRPGDPAGDALSERVHAAIEDACRRKAEEMRTWPALTDNDRLRTAFGALDAQGIVCLEIAGLDQADGLDHVAHLHIVRNEGGREQTHGYCFFTLNDMWRAVDGQGLSLAYGSFEEEPAKPAPEICPLCKGRGWIAPADPSHFPEICSCRKGAPPAAQPAATRTLGERAGDAVVEACRGAGLTVAWSGAGKDFIKLPSFHWQRRMVVTQESDVRDFLESWEIELRSGWTRADAMLPELPEPAGDWFMEFADFGRELLDQLRAHTERFIETERALEATWTGPTTNDRLDAAFASLRGRGLFVLDRGAMTIQDGWALVGVRAAPSDRGAVLLHQEDVIDGIGGLGLRLAFGTFEPDPAENDAASLALGREILSELEAHGVTAEWSGSVHDRIRVLPFEWRKRRWTAAPAFERAPGAGSAKPSLWARLLGRTRPRAEQRDPGARESAQELRKRFVEGGSSTVVKALRTTAGFDVRLSRKLRSAWLSLGSSEPGHVCHLGLPHTFVRCREHTTLAAQSALDNLREEALALRAQGLRAAAATHAAPNEEG